MADGAGILEAAHVEREQLRLGDFAGHPDQLFLDELMAGDGLVVELLSGFGVLQRGRVAVHGRADGAPTDAVAGLIEAHQRAFEAPCAGQQVGCGHVHVLKRQAAGRRRRAGTICRGRREAENRAGRFRRGSRALTSLPLAALAPSSLAQMTATSAMVPEVIHIFSPLRMYSPPDLRARVVMPAGIRSEAGFGQSEAAELFAAGEGGEPGVFLLVGAEGVDGIHDQRRLHADKAAQAGVAAFQLLHHQAVLDIRHAGAAVALEVGAEEAQLAHEGNELARKTALAEAVFDDGNDVVFDEVASGAADEEFVFAEAGVEMKEVEVLEFEGHYTPAIRLQLKTCKASR